MKKAIFFQIFVITLCFVAWIQKPIGNYPNWLIGAELAINCILMATIAGSLYCLRSVYRNKGVYNSWKENWEVWYYIRPITSAISGLASYVFLKAGLIVLEGYQEDNAGNYGYLAFAFIAGLNVDKFVEKIEEIAKAAFGIEKSRTAKDNNNKE